MNKPDIDTAIAQNFTHLRDVSTRDGVQSWDGNKWPIESVIPVVAGLEKLAKAAEKQGVKMAPVEAWGGGQVAQPALFLGEDPLKNLEDIKKAAPSLELQCLYRGRQGFGFEPISPETQQQAISAAADRGVKVFRIFDMMNDIENLTPGLEAMKDYKASHGANSITIEGAVSYISPPDKGQRAMSLKDYADFAVQLAKKGADEIAIKNYAGVGDKEMPALVQTIRHGLDDAGFKGMKINLHTHGQKPDVLLAALKAGADKVDVAIGDLAGGPSHTNMRSMMYEMLKDQGYDVSDPKIQQRVNMNPIMKQMGEVEKTIGAIVKQEPADGKGNFASKRGVLAAFTQEEADHYRVASGALSDLSGRIDSFYGPSGTPPRNFPSKEEFFKRTLEKGRELWEKGGQFNTVTPGAKILIDQAIPLVMDEINGKKSGMGSYIPEYTKIVTGRYGRNAGMDKGVGDTKFRDALLMYEALKTVNNELSNGEISTEQRNNFFVDAAFGSKGQGRLMMSGNQIDLRDPALEEKLKSSDIERVRAAVQKSSFSQELKTRLMAELTPGRSPDPVAGMEVGHEKIAQLKAQGTDIEAMAQEGHRISSGDDAALLSMMLPPKAFDSMVKSIVMKGPQSEASASLSSHTTRAQLRRGTDGQDRTLH